MIVTPPIPQDKNPVFPEEQTTIIFETSDIVPSESTTQRVAASTEEPGTIAKQSKYLSNLMQGIVMLPV